MENIVVQVIDMILVEIQVAKIRQTSKGSISKHRQLIVVQKESVKVPKTFEGARRDITQLVEPQVSETYKYTRG